MQKMIKHIDLQELKRLFHYDPNTGLFSRLVKISNQDVGSIAGTKGSRGHIQIHINYRKHQAHRLAWLYVTGIWPTQHLDHVNGDRTDNRICNLRIASARMNACNREAHREGKLFGCSFAHDRNKWRAYISVNGKILNLGQYNTEQEAHARYLIEREKLEQECK
jgi:hypothetical protein